MTVTKTPLCTVKGCPAPKDPNWHVPWCQRIPDHQCFGGATHQHWPKKGMGGNNPKSKIVSCLCAGAHDRIDNGDWGNAVFDLLGNLTYRAWDCHNETLIERVLEPDSAAEKGSLTERLPTGSAKARLDDGAGSPLSSAAPSGSESPAVEQQTNRVRVLSVGADSSTAELPVPVGNGVAEVRHHAGTTGKADAAVTSATPSPSGAGIKEAPSAPVPAGYASWVKDIKSIAMAGRLWQFGFGDKALEGERLWPHESTQVLSSLGIYPGTLVNIMRVAERIPSELRRSELRWSQHVLVAGLDRETIESVLGRAVAEEWGVSQTRDFLRAEGHLPAPKPRTKRWTLEKLREQATHWHGHHTFGSPSCQDCEGATKFCDWLEKQDETS